MSALPTRFERDAGRPLTPRLHDMTIGAGRGIVRQIGIPFGVEEGIGAKADHHSKKNHHDYHRR